jgi:hypothetical protein
MPAIWLVTDPSYPEAEARRVADGCEEEGTPLAWSVRSGDTKELARFACLSSQLEVGIGIGRDGSAAIALVAVNKEPYIELDAVNARQLRWLGQAAARISKSQPIPAEVPAAIGEPDAMARHNVTAGLSPAQSDDTAELARIVAEALLNGMRKGGGSI